MFKDVKKAIRPGFFTTFSVAKDEEAKTKGVTDEERMLYGLSQSAGWAILTQEIEQLLQEMDSMNDKAIEAGADYEELGKNTLVISLAKNVIRRIVNRVNDAKEACERESTNNGGGVTS